MPFAQLLAGLVQHPVADGDDAAVLFGQRNEQVRRDHAVRGVGPAEQGLDTGDALPAIVHLQLIGQVELAEREGLAQVFLQFATFAHLAVDAGHIELVAVARTRLGQGHGLFGFLQQLLGAVAVFGIQGDADGGLQADLMFVELYGGFQAVEQGLRQFGRFVGFGETRQHQHELIAAQARQCADSTAVGTQSIRQRDEQPVAVLIAELLVDALEVVQPEAEHGHAALQTLGLLEDAVELLLQLQAVRQAGQQIVAGHALQVVLGGEAQLHVVLDGGEQAVGGFDPEPQLVLLVPLDDGQLVFAWAIRVDPRQVFDELRQWSRQQPFVNQIEHQAQRQRAKQAQREDQQRVVDECLAIGRGIHRDVQVAVVFVVGRTPHERHGKRLVAAQDGVGQPA